MNEYFEKVGPLLFEGGQYEGVLGLGGPSGPPADKSG